MEGFWYGRGGQAAHSGAPGERPGLLRRAGPARRALRAERHGPHQPAGGRRGHHRLPRHRRLGGARPRRHRAHRHLPLGRRRPRGRRPAPARPARDRGLLVHRGRRLVHAQGPRRQRRRPGAHHPPPLRHPGRLPHPHHRRPLHQVGEPGGGAP
ncbi:AsnC-family transcriptional regulator [Streptomyces albidoflavus]|nr:AsnC-family transcriptional regulator [Streptomyces albidoflavus]